MSQKTSPFIESKYGWDLGESGWNVGMDENLLKFSFLLDGTIDSVVSTLPSAVNGKSVFSTQDNRVYFCVDGIWYSSSVPAWKELKEKSTGNVYQYNGETLELVGNILTIATNANTAASATTSLESRIASVEAEVTSNTANISTNTNDIVAVTGELSEYQADLSNSSDATKGSSLIGFIQGGSWATPRTLRDKASEIVSVKDFGAKGDGTTDDSSAINACIASLKSTGGSVYFPKGVYIAKNINWTVETTSFNGGGRISLIGDGPALSVISTSSAVNGDNLVSITANTSNATNSVIFGGKISNMGFQILNGTGKTFRVVNSAYMYFENCFFRGGNIAFKTEGCLSSTFVNCKFSEGRYGFYATPGFSYPNQFSFFQCVFTLNTTAALYAQSPGGIRMYGGSVEGNGAGNANAYGVILDHAVGSSSGTSVAGVFSGVYFESNNGIADVYLAHNNTGENVSLTVQDCSFACGGSLIVNDRIKIDHQSATALTARVYGCNFQELSGFAPTATQKYINVFGGGTGLRRVYADDNYYNAVNSIPVAGTVLSRPTSAQGRVEAFTATTNASGVATVSFTAFGAVPIVTATVMGASGNIYSVAITARSTTSASATVYKQTTTGGAWSVASGVNVNFTVSGS